MPLLKNALFKIITIVTVLVEHINYVLKWIYSQVIVVDS